MADGITPVTLHDALAVARAGLTDAGVIPAEAAIDVDLYTRTLLGWDRAQLLTSLSGPVPVGLEPGLSTWTTRRERGEPSAYIVGVKEFWGLEFAVTPAVLIPRPETEFIIEEALVLLGEQPSPRVADVGTGSGCLAIALATEIAGARVVGSDISLAALVVASGNAALHSVADRVAFVGASFLDGVVGPFDLIMANPPYVRNGDGPGLSRPVRYEPKVALFGGDGLGAIESTLDAAIQSLTPGGWLVMEFGYGQEEDVAARVARRPALRLDHVHSDLQQIPRTAVIQRVEHAPHRDA